MQERPRDPHTRRTPGRDLVLGQDAPELLTVFVSAEDEWIHPPAVVVSDPMPIPRSGAVLYFLRIRTDCPTLGTVCHART